MLSIKQVENIAHAIGLQGRKRKPYRNYYNTGRDKCPSWDDLVKRGLATHRDVGKEMGSHYYHLSDKGFEFVLKNPKTFDMDRRVKHVKTLKSWCHD